MYTYTIGLSEDMFSIVTVTYAISGFTYEFIEKQ